MAKKHKIPRFDYTLWKKVNQDAAKIRKTYESNIQELDRALKPFFQYKTWRKHVIETVVEMSSRYRAIRDFDKVLSKNPMLLKNFLNALRRK